MEKKPVYRSKFFWHWEDDKEEAWLTEMAKQGLHLVKPGALSRYTFVQGEPRNEIYRLDFIQSGKKDDAYMQLFQDAGWEYAGEMMGWQYWHKEVGHEETAEIYTDPESKIQKYQRLLGFLLILSLPVLMGFINMRIFQLPELLASELWIEWVFAGVIFLFIFAFLFYSYIFVNIGLRILKLKRRG